MKKFISLMIVALFATASFAQDNKYDAKPDVMADLKMSHECYMMKKGVLFHCTGTDAKAFKENVTLKNGTVLSANGDVKQKDGSTSKLSDGQCVSLMGGIGSCEEMHAVPKEVDEKVKEEKMK